MDSQDSLLVFSTSGNSPNIVAALASAKELGCKTLALLGKNGGKAKELADLSLVIESDNTARIQEAHITVVHCLMEALEGDIN